MSAATGRLSGASAIVVGAGTPADGLSNGAACALLFAREGAQVLCVDRSEEAAAETVQRIKAEGGAASAFVADAQDTAQLQAMVQTALARHGAVDVLHYNVGIEEFGELIDVTDESWDRVHAINLRGAMAAARAVMPHMMARRNGSIMTPTFPAATCWGAGPAPLAVAASCAYRPTMIARRRIAWISMRTGTRRIWKCSTGWPAGGDTNSCSARVFDITM